MAVPPNQRADAAEAPRVPELSSLLRRYAEDCIYSARELSALALLDDIANSAMHSRQMQQVVRGVQ